MLHCKSDEVVNSTTKTSEGWEQVRWELKLHDGSAFEDSGG